MMSNAGYRGLKHLQAIGTERWFPLRERLWQLQTNLRWGRLCNRQLTYGLTMQVNKEKCFPRHEGPWRLALKRLESIGFTDYDHNNQAQKGDQA
ncbi:unnamed protein product [Sphagnum jensenii]|uniref:Uncharacterized protein n=1 Tax=Sphagnum jensenii TaxID=128206 RepID=A0ABP0WA35_9BRYO